MAIPIESIANQSWTLLKLHPSFIHRIKARIQADHEGGRRWVADTLNRAVSTLALREIILVRRLS
ncbi:hypothetical protein EMIT0158MI4_370004 [Burkholderia ambifaria]